MISLTLTCVAALLLGMLTPKHWSVWGFLGAAVLLFVGRAVWSTAMGFTGSSIEDSLLLFNGSYMSYVGFNLQITYRAFALPELVLAAVFVARLRWG